MTLSKGSILPALLLLLFSCSRPLDAPRIEASNRPSADQEAVAPTPTPSVPSPEFGHPAALEPPADGESHRTALARLDAEPLLRPFLGVLREHFASSRRPFAMQRIDLAGGRMALLVTGSNDRDPMVLVIDRDELVWSKPHPTAGIVPPLLHLAIAPRPDGGVALFGYVFALHIVAARMWADDGNAYAEIELATIDACDALSAGWASGFGWVVACASRSGTRAQHLREDGTTAWGPAGSAVGATSPVGPATLVFEPPTAWVLLQRAKGAAGDHLLAWRYDGEARPLWPSFVDIGAPSRLGGGERFVATPVGEGGVRVEWPEGSTSKTAKAVEIASSGELRTVR